MIHHLAQRPSGHSSLFPRLLRTATMLVVGCSAIFATMLVVESVKAGSVKRPNVVLIMTDDMGYGDLGFHGNPLIVTPNLDAMAGRSSLIEQFYVSPVCAPTRASLMTGRYNYRTRVVDTWVGRAMMDPAEVTVAELLSEAGYMTGIFGKWHLGDCYPLRPMDQGFAESLVHHGGGIGQPSDPPGGEGKYTDPILFRNGEAEQMQGYCTDVYYSAAIDFIEASSDAGKPFFVYLPDNCPHGPFDDVPPGDYAEYQKRNLNDDQFPQEHGHPLPNKAKVDQRARIFAMITNVDRNIGRLLAKLDSLGLTENTMVIFMVDNGPNGRRYVAGMKGNKSMVHEGGIRSPFFVQWPAGLTNRVEVEGPYAHIDVLPTLLEACGVPLPESLQIDGISFLSELQGEPKADTGQRPIVIQSHRGDRPFRFHNFMIRQGDWKLLHGSGFSRESFSGQPRFELFHLGEDPLELKNVVDEHPEVVARLKAEYEKWFADVGNTRPDNYAPPRIQIGTPFENPTTLTRQDWRHAAGQPWGRDSIGFWLLHVASSGNYDIECRFEPHDKPETITLISGDNRQSERIEPGTDKFVFEAVTFEDGDMRLHFELDDGTRIRGIHQADVALE